MFHFPICSTTLIVFFFSHHFSSLGESCCESEFKLYERVIRKHMGENVHIKTVQIGDSPLVDRIRSLTTHPFEQIKLACEELKNDTNFRNGYNGIGLSQGGLLM